MALDGVSGQRHAPGRFTVGREYRCPLYGRLVGAPWPVWRDAENLAPTGIRSPGQQILLLLLLLFFYDEYIGQAQILSTRYEVGNLGIESCWVEIFGTLPDLSWGLPRGKAPGEGC